MDELLLDILCYLREQSKYDKRASALFHDLIDNITIKLNTEVK